MRLLRLQHVVIKPAEGAERALSRKVIETNTDFGLVGEPVLRAERALSRKVIETH